MKHIIMAGLPVFLALTLLLLTGSVTRAEETTCSGFLGAVTVDNLRVPQNASCTLHKTTVQGTIKVENSASLTATQVTVIGNVQAEGAKAVNVLAGSTIGGSIQIKQGKAARVNRAHVNGDILFDSNNRALIAGRNQVGGNVQVFQNTGGVTIAGNTIDGNLQCKENVPPPIVGNNVVHGNKEDQCASPSDTTLPETMILSGPPAAIPSGNAVFIFSGSDNATLELLMVFECALDGATFEECVSPYATQNLPLGEHQLQVRALDQALNVDPTPASYTWTITESVADIYLPLVVQN